MELKLEESKYDKIEKEKEKKEKEKNDNEKKDAAKPDDDLKRREKRKKKKKTKKDDKAKEKEKKKDDKNKTSSSSIMEDPSSSDGSSSDDIPEPPPAPPAPQQLTQIPVQPIPVQPISVQPIPAQPTPVQPILVPPIPVQPIPVHTDYNLPSSYIEKTPETPHLPAHVPRRPPTYPPKPLTANKVRAETPLPAVMTPLVHTPLVHTPLGPTQRELEQQQTLMKISADYHNLKDAQEKMEQQNEDLQHELAKLRQHEIADRLVIDETVKSATSDEIADNYLNLRRKYVGVKEENDKLRNLLITAKKTGSAVPPVLLANHVQPQTNPTTLQPFLAGNVQRMEQVIQDQDAIITKLEDLLSKTNVQAGSQYQQQIDELYNLTRARPRVYPIHNVQPNTAGSIRSVPQALPTNKLEDILDREAKRNDKLEREIHHLTNEHKNEKEQLVRELRTLRESERLAREAAQPATRYPAEQPPLRYPPGQGQSRYDRTNYY